MFEIECVQWISFDGEETKENQRRATNTPDFCPFSSFFIRSLLNVSYLLSNKLRNGRPTFCFLLCAASVLLVFCSIVVVSFDFVPIIFRLHAGVFVWMFSFFFRFCVLHADDK